jgi:hypothetical protein
MLTFIYIDFSRKPFFLGTNLDVFSDLIWDTNSLAITVSIFTGDVVG